jgi:hypothetical protein
LNRGRRSLLRRHFTGGQLNRERAHRARPQANCNTHSDHTAAIPS